MKANDREQVLRDAADRFHRILSALESRRLIARGVKNAVLHSAIAAKVIPDEEISRVAADGFEACVRALHDMSASDVTIRECNPDESRQAKGEE
jgi:hypothetical protein